MCSDATCNIQTFELSHYQVLHQLPDKLESVEHCTLTPDQWRLYCREVEQGRREMKDGNGEKGVAGDKEGGMNALLSQLL